MYRRMGRIGTAGLIGKKSREVIEVCILTKQLQVETC